MNLPDWLQPLQEMWLQTSTTNKLLLVAMLCVVLGIFSQVTRMTNPKRQYKGKTTKAVAMETLASLELENVRSAYQKARDHSRRYDALLQLAARLAKEDVEPEYNIYVPLDEKSELQASDFGKRIRSWIAEHPQMRATVERCVKSCEKAAAFDRGVQELPAPETEEEFDGSLMKYRKYREIEEEIVNDGIRKMRPLEPQFTFHFYHRASQGRSTAEVTQRLTPEELLELWKQTESYSPRF